MIRTWLVTYLVPSLDPERPQDVGRMEVEVTAHCLWAAAMRAQQQLKIDARDLLAAREIGNAPVVPAAPVVTTRRTPEAVIAEAFRE